MEVQTLKYSPFRIISYLASYSSSISCLGMMSQESCHHLRSQIERGYWNMLHLHLSFYVCCGFHYNLPRNLIRHICYSSRPLPSSSGALCLDRTLWFRSDLYLLDILDLQRNGFGFSRNTRFSKFDQSYFGARDLLDDFHVCYGDDPLKLSQARLGDCQYQSLKECLPEPSSSSSRCWTGRRWRQQRMSPVWSSWRVEDV